jgi:hypothetical protein
MNNDEKDNHDEKNEDKEFTNCNIVCLVELYHTNNNETTNNKNKRGRKICPITFIELTSDNTVKVGNTLFSSSGLSSRLKSQYWYCDYTVNDIYYNFNIKWIMQVKHPMTNLPFTKEEASVICVSVLKKTPYFDLDEGESEYESESEDDE